MNRPFKENLIFSNNIHNNMISKNFLVKIGKPDRD